MKIVEVKRSILSSYWYHCLLDAGPDSHYKDSQQGQRTQDIWQEPSTEWVSDIQNYVVNSPDAILPHILPRPEPMMSNISADEESCRPGKGKSCSSGLVKSESSSSHISQFFGQNSFQLGIISMDSGPRSPNVGLSGASPSSLCSATSFTPTRLSPSWIVKIISTVYLLWSS